MLSSHNTVKLRGWDVGNEFCPTNIKGESIMKKRNIVLASFMAITILATSSAMVFASSATASTSLNSNHDKAKANSTNAAFANLTDAQRTALQQDRGANLKDALANLVKSGVFTKSQADAIIAAIPTAPVEKAANPVSALTDTQKTALEARIKLIEATNIKTLITDGTITQAQADQLNARCQDRFDGQNRFNDQAKSFGKNVDKAQVAKSEIDQPLALTDAQRTAIQASRTAAMKTAIVELVAEKVITQTEADAITTAIANEPQERGNAMVKNLTDAQRTALQTEMQKLAADHLKTLVDAGTLTQAQADQMSKVGHGMMDGNGRGHGPEGNMMNRGTIESTEKN